MVKYNCWKLAGDSRTEVNKQQNVEGRMYSLVNIEGRMYLSVNVEGRWKW